MRGNLVIARCYKDIPAVLRVWESNGKMIYLSEESQFQRLSNGLDALRPVGFPPEDVFAYDPRLAKKIAKGSLDWSSMQKFNALSRQN
jgi:hypothetical protein